MKHETQSDSETSAPVNPVQLRLARFFEVLAEEDDEAREHLQVRLTAEQCAEVARILREPISLFECSPGDGAPVKPAPCRLCGGTGKRRTESDHGVIHHNEFTDMPSGRRGHPFFPKDYVPRTPEEARNWFRALRRDKDDDLMVDALLTLLKATGTLMSNPTDDTPLDEPPERTTLDQELTGLLNRFCQENGSETPDYILADYMLGCLRVLERAVIERSRWYGEQETNRRAPLSELERKQHATVERILQRRRARHFRRVFGCEPCFKSWAGCGRPAGHLCQKPKGHEGPCGCGRCWAEQRWAPDSRGTHPKGSERSP